MSEMERAREEEQQDGLGSLEMLSPRSRHQTLGSGIVQRRGRMATEPLQQRLFINQTSEAATSSPVGLWPAVDGLGSLSRNRTASNLDNDLQSPEGLAKSASLQSIRFIDEERIEAHRRQQAHKSGSIKGLTMSALNKLYWFTVFFGLLGILASGTVLISHTIWHPEFGKNPVFERAAVAAEQEMCSKVGVDLLKQGGNAVDAAIGSLLCIGVINNFSSGVGGGGYILIRVNATYSTVIDYRETAPAGTRIEDYNADPDKLIEGGLSVAVPSQLKGLEMAHRLHGKLPWAAIFQPAIAIARQGFHVTPKLASMISKCAGKIALSPAMRETYLKAEGPQDGVMAKPKRFKSKRQEKMYRKHLEKAQRNKTWVPKGVGDLVLRPNLASTLERVAKEGSDAFYKGEIAEAMVAEVQAAGGRLSLDDLAQYEPIQRTPLVSEFRGFKVTSVGAPAAGAILIQILKVLERLPLRNCTSSAEKHLFLEALKFGYAGRIRLGDPAFNTEMGQVERDILAQATIDTIHSSIDYDHTHEPEYYTQIYGDIKDRGTTHLSVLDIDGMAVSVTDTVNLEFGAFLMDGKTGVLLNNEMGDFSLEHTQNSYGLPPSLANLVQAGKRPMSSSTPVVLERNGQVVLVTGAAGGSRIISVTAQVVADLLLYRLDPVEAMTKARFHHQLFPNEVIVDDGADPRMLQDLIAKGHIIKKLPPGTTLTSLQLIIKRENGKIWALSDPRKGGLADGY